MKAVRLIGVPFAAILLASCDWSLGFDIFNATDGPIIVMTNGTSASVEPGLSYHGRFPNERTFSVKAGDCVRVYPVPNLDQPPWRFLVGKSMKFRAMSSGVMQAYPPTPDVELKGNPLRAMTDSEAQIRPIREDCR